MNNKDDPSCLAKMLQDFRRTPRMTPLLHLRGSSYRVSGAFPLPGEVSTSTPSVLGPKEPFKRPFDETVLNENDFLIKRSRRKSYEDSLGSDNSVGDTSVSASPWEVRRLKSEVLEAKAEILNLESRISQLHGLRKETEVVFEQEKASLKSTIERDRSTITKLEGRLKLVKRREEQLKETSESVLGKLEKETEELKSKCMALEEENLELKEFLNEAETRAGESRREASSLSTELTGVRAEFEAAKEQLAALNAALVPLRKTARQAEIDKAALTAAQMKISEMESELKNQAETAELVKSQQNNLMRYSELERQLLALTHEHSKLRRSTSNSLYLEGVVEDLKLRLQGLDEREKDVKGLRVELGLAEGRLKEWERMASVTLSSSPSTSSSSPSATSPSPSPSPSSLASYIKWLHSDHLEAVGKTSFLEAKLRNLEESEERTRKEQELRQKEVEKLKKELEVSSANIKRLKKQNNVITWERNALRSLVDSCQKEVTMQSLVSDPKVEPLEKLCEGYRKQLDLKIESLDPPQSQEAGSSERQELELERDELKRKVEELELELEQRALKGDFNIKNTQVLHLRVNPTSDAVNKREDELSLARSEVQRLRERVRLLKEGRSADVTQAVNERVSQASTKQVEDLEEKLKSQEVQNLRLREVFKVKVNEFREAIHALLGYKVDCLPNGVYKLSSLYAESPDDHLKFKMSSTETVSMELLETEYSKTLTGLIELHLSQHHSIPMFLSTITVDLFQQQTTTY